MGVYSEGRIFAFVESSSVSDWMYTTLIDHVVSTTGTLKFLPAFDLVS